MLSTLTLLSHILPLLPMTSWLSMLLYYVGILDRELPTWSAQIVGGFLLWHMEPTIHRSIFVAPRSGRIGKFDFSVCLWRSIWDRPINGVYFACIVAEILYLFILQHESNLNHSRGNILVPNVKCQKTCTSIVLINDKKKVKELETSRRIQ